MAIRLLLKMRLVDAQWNISKVEKIEAELEKLSASELLEVRFQFTDEFEAPIAQSEREMKLRIRPRVRQPDLQS